MNVNCTFRLPGDPWDGASILGNARLGRLTDEHAASSYGLPVVVGEDGTAYGGGEVEGGEISVSRDGLADEQYEECIGRALDAGYRVPGWPRR